MHAQSRTRRQKGAGHLPAAMLPVVFFSLLLTAAAPAADFTAHWVGDTTGNWTDPARWSTGTYPNNGASTYDAIIDVPASANYYVELAKDVTVNSVLVNSSKARLRVNTGGVLRLAGPATVDVSAGMLYLSGGTIVGGQVNCPSAQASISGGTLDGTIWNGTLPSFTGRLRLTNGASFTGSAVAVGQSSWLDLDQDCTLSGKTITLAGYRSPFPPFPPYTDTPAYLGIGDGRTVTIAAGTTIYGRIGSITNSATGGAGGTLINEGLISADTSAKWLTIGTTSFINRGTLEVKNGASVTIDAAGWSNTGAFTLNNGTLNLGGSFTTADMGIGGWQRAGTTTVNITGTLDNTGALLDLNSTGALTLDGGTVLGGQIANPSGKLEILSGVLDGTLLDGNMAMTQSGGTVVVRNGAGFTGNTVTLSGSGTDVSLDQNQTLAGKTIGLDYSGLGTNRQGIGVGEGRTLTLASDTVLRASNGEVFDYDPTSAGGALINEGRISADTSGKQLDIRTSSFTNRGIAEAINSGILTVNSPAFVNEQSLRAGSGSMLTVNSSAFVNEGSLQADSGSALTINATSWSNAGTLTMNNATVNLGGSFTTAAMGIPQWTRTGGTVKITGALDNTGAVLDSAATGPLLFEAGTIRGGELVSSTTNLVSFLDHPNAYIDTPSVLDGVTVTGGDVKLQGAVLTNGTSLQTEHVSLRYAILDQDLTVANTQLALGELRVAEGRTLILEPTVTVEVGHSSVQADQSAIWPVSGSQTGYFENRTTISIAPGQSCAIGAPTWSNKGVITNYGELVLGGSFSVADVGNCTWAKEGGTVWILGTMDNTGHVLDLADTGPLSFNGTIKGGTVSPSAQNPLSLRPGNPTLDGVTLEDVINVPASETGLYVTLHLMNGTTFLSNTINVGAKSRLEIHDGRTLSGMAIALADKARLGGSVTLAPNTTVTGTSYTVNGPLVNQTNLIAADLTIGGTGFVNEGTIGTSTGGKLTFDGTNWWNLGTVIADNATVTLGGSFATGALGFNGWQRTGGTISITGLVDNTGDILDMTAVGGVQLSGGMITGGLVRVTPGAPFPGSGRLNSATVEGDLLVDGTQLWLEGSASSTSRTAIVRGPVDKSILHIPNGVVFQSFDTIRMEGGSLASGGAGTQPSLTLGSTTRLCGYGWVAYHNGWILRNEGTISADVPGKELLLWEDSELTNCGTLEARNGGTFRYRDYWTQTAGTAHVWAGSVITTETSWADINILGGVLTGSGLVQFLDNGDVTLAAATLAPGDAVGTLTVAGGRFNLAASSLLDYQLGTPGVVGGTENDLLLVDTRLTLNGTLNVTAMMGFGAGTYRLINYTGTFVNNGLEVGLMPPGFTGTIDTSVTGQVNLVVEDIPEPASLAMLAFGSLAVLGRRARRQSHRCHDLAA